MKNRKLNPLSATLGTVVGMGLAGLANASVGQNPFSVTEIEPVTVAAAAQAQCGADKAKARPAEARCGAKTGEAAEAKCGADKKAAPQPIREASCGEAKCGARK